MVIGVNSSSLPPGPLSELSCQKLLFYEPEWDAGMGPLSPQRKGYLLVCTGLHPAILIDPKCK